MTSESVYWANVLLCITSILLDIMCTCILQDHERILKEIAEDRERKKLTTATHAAATATQPEGAPSANEKTSPSGPPPEKKHTQDTCSIQVGNIESMEINTMLYYSPFMSYRTQFS